jgi:transcriptional regulator
VEKNRLELFRGALDIMILKALIWGPLHGYAVTTLIRRQSEDALLVEEGTLYPALWRLERRGFIEAEWGLSENNRKAKYYSLTSSGRRHLRAESKIWEAYARAVAKVLGATEPPVAERS